jgi:hypothetical protein
MQNVATDLAQMLDVERGTQKVSELADGAGLLYPPDPGSIRISTIG